MKRTAFFLVVVLLPLAGVVGVTWRVDPAGYVYHRDAVRAALASQPQCLISHAVVGQESWVPFKLDLLAMRPTTTVVMGTSRVLEMRARPGEKSFTNLGIPGTGIETLRPFFARMHRVHPGPLTIYLGMDTFWLNRTWLPTLALSHSFGSTFRYLASSSTFHTSYTLARQHPDLLLKGWQRTTVDGRCAVDRAGLLATGQKNAWEPDGSLDYNFQLVPSMRTPPSDDYTRDVVLHLGAYYKFWTAIDRKRLVELDRALAQAKGYGWRVVGYFVPYSPRYVKGLSSNPQTGPRWRELGRIVPPVFARNGFRFLDLRDVRDVPCAPTAFVDDGWHPTAACDAAVRRRLDVAARATP